MGMETAQIPNVLSAAREAVEAGEGLGGTGFWKVVASLKRHPELVDRYGPRVSEIDRRAFLGWAAFTVGAAAGTALMVLATLAGVALVVWSHSLPDPWNGLVMLGGGGGVLVTTTHGLGHLAADGWRASGSPIGSSGPSEGPSRG